MRRCLMMLWRNDPWRALRLLRTEMDRAFRDIGRPRAAAFPPVNIRSDEEGLMLTAELPGVDPESLSITALKDRLTIRGERRTAPSDEECTWHRRERRWGNFSRTIDLPFAIDADSVDASCRNGVLRARLRRPESEKPRKIEVKTA
jgi:HSP20 family protein